MNAPITYSLIGAGVVIFIVLVFLGIYFYKKNIEKIFKYKVYKKLYSLALDNDYYLLNNLVIKLTNDVSLHISHLIVGEKFIYVISSRYYNGSLKGKSYASSDFELISKNTKDIHTISNPVIYNEKRTILFAKYLGWDESKPMMLLSIVVTNNDVEYLIEDKKLSKGSYLCHIKELKKLITKIEKETNVSKFDEKKLQVIVDKIHKISTDDANYEKRNEQLTKKQYEKERRFNEQ